MTDAPHVLIDSAVLETVESLVPHPQNPRQGDVGAIAESIRAHGFYAPLVAQTSTRHVVVGNHRLLAARALGMLEVPVVWIDVDDERALRILLADNRTSDLGAYDDQALATLLADLAQTTTEALEGTGYEPGDLDALLADLDTTVPPHAAEGLTAAERKVVQLDVSTIRQIILILGVEEFREAVTILAEMRRRDDELVSNTDCLMVLLREWAEREGFTVADA